MDKITLQNQAAYNEHASGWASAMPTHVKYKYLEKPAMEAELPDDLTGKRVLSIGAGSGEELGAIIARNPKEVVATDISGELLEIAQDHLPDVQCNVMDMHVLDFSESSFNLVYSSLAFHYTKDWDVLLAEVHRVLTPGGTLLFSTHHSGYWSKHPTGTIVTNARGMKLTEHTATLPGGVGITYYNQPNTDAIDEAVRHAGFTIEHAFVPGVMIAPPHTLTPSERNKYNNLVKTNKKTPLFYVVRAFKR